MTNAEIIQAIRNEIERRITDNTFGAKLELIDILAWLDTIESEKPINLDDAMKELDEKIALVKQRGTWDGVDVDKYMDEMRGREPEKPVPNDLKEAAWDCVLDSVDVNNPVLLPKYKELLIYLFIAGSKWQKQHDAELIEIAYNDGITIGMTKQKEQMMKEAVEGKIIFLLNGDVAVNIGDTDEYKLGQKVRVIVCKKDD